MGCISQWNTSYKVIPYQEVEGINSKSITQVVQSLDGFIWMGTQQGLVRYDSYGYRRYENQTGFCNSIKFLTVASNNRLWLLFTDNTIAYFDCNSGQFENISLANLKIIPAQATIGIVNKLYVDKKNQLWLCSSNNGGWIGFNAHDSCLYQYDVLTKNNSFFPPQFVADHNRVTQALEDETGLYWLTTPDGLYRFDPNTKKTIPVLNKRGHSVSEWRDDNFTCMLMLGNNLYLGSWGGGLSVYNKKTNAWKVVKFDSAKPKSYTANIIHSIVAKSDSELYIASPDKGLLGFNTHTLRFHYFSNDAQVPRWLWRQVMIDKDRTLWGLNVEGLTQMRWAKSRFQYHPFSVSHSDNNIFYLLTDVWENNRSRLIATQFADGIHIIDKKTGKSILRNVRMLPKEEGPYSIVNALVSDDSTHAMVVSRDYLYRYDARAQQLVPLEQPPLLNGTNTNFFTCAAKSLKGEWWFGSYCNGFFRYNRSGHLIGHYRENAHPDSVITHNAISAMASDAFGRIWYSSKRGMIGFIDPASGLPASKNRLSNIYRDISTAKAFWIFADHRGLLWVSTDNGLLVLDCKKEIPSLLNVYSAQNGLQHHVLTGLCEDDNGMIWGVNEATFTLSCIHPTTGQITHFGIKEGIDQFGALYRVKKTEGGKLWLLAQGGYYEFDPVFSAPPSQSPKLALTSFEVNGSEMQLPLPNAAPVQLSASDNNLHFSFAAIDYSANSNYKYAYALEGLSETWNNNGQQRTVDYSGLAGGSYVFKVRMLQGGTGKILGELSIPFFIATPFYKNPVFIAGLLVLTIVALYGLLRYWINKKEQIVLLEWKANALAKEKTQMEYESLKQHLNPHFLFNSLTSLSSLIRFDPKTASTFLDGMSKIYRYILQSKNEETVSLRKEINFVKTFIYLQTTRFGDGLQILIDISEEQMGYKIVPVTLQNLIENAIKHNLVEVSSPLVVRIFCEGEFLIVRNNMQVKKFVGASNQQGLSNMKLLYSYLSEKPLSVHSDDEYFTVKIPLL